MRISSFLLPSALVVLGFSAGCSLRSSSPSAQPPSAAVSCPSPPTGTDKSSLIGIWQADYDGVRRETLTFQADGTYLQEFENSATGYAYEGEPGIWKLAREPSGALYIRLEGALWCEYEDSCTNPETASRGMSYYDACADRFVVMDREITLAVVGEVPLPLAPAAPRGIILLLMVPPGREGPPSRFVLLED